MTTCASAWASRWAVARPMPETDVSLTFADVSRARRFLDYDPRISVQEGIELFWDWYRESVLGGLENAGAENFA